MIASLGSPVATYVYTDEHDAALYFVSRYESEGEKTFRQHRLLDGQPVYNLNDVRRVPYRLSELNAGKDEPIIVVEGEKDADNLSALGFTVTTNAGGCATRWTPEFCEHFRNKLVVLVADNDDPGRAAVLDRAEALWGIATAVRVIEYLPEVAAKGDVSDLIALGWDREKFGELFLKAKRYPYETSMSPKSTGFAPISSPLSPIPRHLHAVKNGKVATGNDGGCRLDVVRLSDVQPETVEWLWASRIPKSKVTLLVGDPGTGKSFASLAISASVTNGTPLPPGGEARPPASVLIWNGEDGVADTIRPRAESCGANLERIHVIDGEIDEATGKKSPFGLHSLDKIEQYIAESGEDFGLIVIDPLSALMAGTDTHRDADVRSALQPLADFAKRSDAAVLLVAHLTKAQAERALYRAAGSIGFVGVARSVLLAAIDPEDGRRAIAPLKCNLAAMPSPILYHIDEQGRFWWGQSANDLTAEHLLRPVKYGGARQNVKDCIHELLDDGRMAAAELESRAKERGFAIATINRARRDLGVIAEKQGDKWFVRLP